MTVHFTRLRQNPTSFFNSLIDTFTYSLPARVSLLTIHFQRCFFYPPVVLAGTRQVVGYKFEVLVIENPMQTGELFFGFSLLPIASCLLPVWTQRATEEQSTQRTAHTVLGYMF